MKAIIITALVVFGLVAISYSGNNVSRKDIVYEMCQASRATDSVSEQTCGELQNFYHVEYLCKERNSSLNNKCWVEEL